MILIFEIWSIINITLHKYEYNTFITDMQIGQEVYVVSALDPDSTPDQVTFDFTPTGNPESTFIIDRYSGRITLNKALDHEIEDMYVLNLIANDSVHAVRGDLHVSVIDENDNPPVFKASTYEVCLLCVIILGLSTCTYIPKILTSYSVKF